MGIGPHGMATWNVVLQHPTSAVRAAATVALATACLVEITESATHGGSQSAVPNEVDMPKLVDACATNAAERNCKPLRDASCLTLVALLTTPSYPESLRTRTLHTAEALKAMCAAF